MPTLNGKVLTVDDTAPAPAVLVSLKQPNQILKTAQTDGTGTYTFSEATGNAAVVGKYRVRPIKSKVFLFDPLVVKGKVPAAGTTADDITAVSPVITGKVVVPLPMPGGSTVPSVPVTLTLTQPGQPDQNATTDGTGTYAFNSAVLGPYNITPLVLTTAFFVPSSVEGRITASQVGDVDLPDFTEVAVGQTDPANDMASVVSAIHDLLTVHLEFLPTQALQYATALKTPRTLVSDIQAAIDAGLSKLG